MPAPMLPPRGSPISARAAVSPGALSPKQGSPILSSYAQGLSNLQHATQWKLPGIQVPVKTTAAHTLQLNNPAANHVKATQQMLKNQGYNIAVDGVPGPQTSAAISAFHNKVAPAAFNARLRTPASAAAPVGKVPPSKQPSNLKTPNVSAGNFNPVKGTSTASTPTGAFDPNAFATAAANAQYDPAIQSLQNQISGYQGNENNFLQAIKDMYAGASQQYQQLLNGETQQGQQTQADLGQQFGNAGQLFGQSNQGLMQTPQGIAQGELAGVNQSEQDYLRNMQPIMQASGASQVTNANSQIQNQIASLMSQLQNQQQAKGNAYVTDYQTGLNNSMQLQQNQQAINTANALLPYQISAAKSTATADAANAAAAPYINAATINAKTATASEASARIPLIQAQTTKALADAKKALVTGGNKNLLPGSTGRQKLMATLNNALLTTDPNTGAVTKLPAPQASQALFQSAVQQGLMSPDGKELYPGFAGILKTTLETAYPGYKWPWMKK